MAVDNNVCLELGYANKGAPADNHHAGPMHPEHDPSVGRLPFDPAKAKALMAEAGMADYEHFPDRHFGMIGQSILSAQQTGTTDHLLFKSGV